MPHLEPFLWYLLFALAFLGAGASLIRTWSLPRNQTRRDPRVTGPGGLALLAIGCVLMVVAAKTL